MRRLPGLQGHHAQRQVNNETMNNEQKRPNIPLRVLVAG